MAAIPSGEKTISAFTSAVDASVLPRKRYRQTGFSVKDGPYKRIKRPSMDNPRAAELNVKGPPRLPLILSRTRQPDFGARGNL